MSRRYWISPVGLEQLVRERRRLRDELKRIEALVREFDNPYRGFDPRCVFCYVHQKCPHGEGCLWVRLQAAAKE